MLRIFPVNVTGLLSQIRVIFSDGRANPLPAIHEAMEPKDGTGPLHVTACVAAGNHPSDPNSRTMLACNRFHFAAAACCAPGATAV